MTEYYIFLRGINVGGHHKVPMAELRELLGQMGYEKVKTFLASGNVRLEADDTGQKELEETLSRAIENKFAFPVPVICRSSERMQKLFRENAYAREKEDKKIKWLVTFLKNDVQVHPETEETEGFSLVYKAPDLVCGVLDLEKSGSPDAMKVLEKAYGKEITSRTWQTLQKMRS